MLDRLPKAYVYFTSPSLPNAYSYQNVHRRLTFIENVIRPLAIGRKNYLFCGNDDAAVRAAIIYSLISSCKAANVDPREWMTDVLIKLPVYKESKRNISELLPRYWENSLKPTNL